MKMNFGFGLWFDPTIRNYYYVIVMLVAERKWFKSSIQVVFLPLCLRSVFSAFWKAYLEQVSGQDILELLLDS